MGREEEGGRVRGEGIEVKGGKGGGGERRAGEGEKRAE